MYVIYCIILLLYYIILYNINIIYCINNILSLSTETEIEISVLNITLVLLIINDICKSIEESVKCGLFAKVTQETLQSISNKLYS